MSPQVAPRAVAFRKVFVDVVCASANAPIATANDVPTEPLSPIYRSIAAEFLAKHAVDAVAECESGPNHTMFGFVL